MTEDMTNHCCSEMKLAVVTNWNDFNRCAGGNGKSTGQNVFILRLEIRSTSGIDGWMTFKRDYTRCIFGCFVAFLIVDLLRVIKRHF